jgi:protein-tyrosine phosphatase
MDKETRLAGQWREAGAILQVNYGSILGRYGDLPRKRALILLERGWVDLMASDFHGRPHLSPSITEAREVFRELGGGPQFGLLAGLNPSRILRGEDPIPVPSLTLKPGVWQKIREVFQNRERR